MADQIAAEKVTFLTTWLSYGGAEVQVVQLAIGLKARGWDVTVTSMRDPEVFTEELQRHGIDVVSLGMSRGRLSWRGVRQWVGHLRRRQPAIVHSHMVHANIFARVLRPVVSNYVLISTAHNIDEGGRWRDLAYRLTDRLATLTTNVSDAATARYVQDGLVPAGRVRTVPNGVDTRRFTFDAGSRAALRAELDLGDASFVWLCVGRFVPAKDHPTLLKAFGPLAQLNAHVILLLVGEGELQGEAKHLARVYGIERQVRFLGRRDDVAGLMSAADAYVMSSAWEGLPMVLLEAGASGLPIVATNVGGNAEIVTSNSANHLVPAGNAQALRESMQAVMALRADERRAGGAANTQMVRENFSLDIVLDRWEALYRNFGERG